MTVSDVAELIRERAELRAEMRALAARAFDQWREIDARLEELEERMNSHFEHVFEPRAEMVSVRVVPSSEN